ncbi:hypothetical protein GCM10011611_38850 [Aliidongia dinghuensis]|uniref:Uncharacterized protein n=1 Tax=Aliidongia dinghuensis TaxID=1867774 RepID=A0A8J3E3C0_9PROT|nr:hypothetical protein [Aliidongia dinghuensis]GGF28995.1 hypothetical protein GCM10011611_38850 [Aliidongia dinghuensis]
MDERRPIDLLRNSGGQMTIGPDDDPSPIKTMCVINNSLHIIKGKGIYCARLADEIDPDRTNPAIPNTSQRVLAYGTDCDLVRQTLLTAKRLFDSHSKALGPSFPYERAINLSFEALKDLIVMHEMQARLAAEISAAEASLKDRAIQNRSFALPTIIGIHESVEMFLQKSAHAVGDLFSIAQLFHPDGLPKGWFDALFQIVQAQYGSDAEFTKFLVEALPVLKLIRNARNCVEHPKPGYRVEVQDVTLLPSGELRAPALEIIHPETPQPLMEVSAFMAQAVEQVAGIFELVLAFLCGHAVQPVAGLPLAVVRYTPQQEAAFDVRFGYATRMGDQIVPFG